MEATSLKGLTQIVERAENVADRVRLLKVEGEDVQIPDVPVPLSLEATDKWMDVAEECCRKPLLARSKQLLESKGIGTATIAAAVLDKPESIAELLQGVASLHEGLHTAAFEAVGRALTKSIEDAEAVIEEFTGASREIDTLAGGETWIAGLAAARVAERPGGAQAVGQLARRVVEYCNAGLRAGIEITAFASLEEASEALIKLNARMQAYDALLVAEGLSDEHVSLAGLQVDDALNSLTQATRNVESEKYRLTHDAQTLQSQLELVGGGICEPASTVAEFRRLVPELTALLEERRGIFRGSLGPTAFGVVESLAEGKLPIADKVTNEELGNAIRKAVECGYRFYLEAPRENR
jgi:hypothetical protein